MLIHVAGSISRLVASALIVATGLSPSAFANGAQGTDIPVMVLQDDSNKLSLPASSSVSDYTSTKIKEQFSRYQYYVVDRNALAAQLGFDLSKRMDTPTVMRMAIAAKQSGQAQLDVRGAVIYKIFPQIKDEGFRKRLVVEIAGEVHDIEASRYIGDFGPLSKTFSAPADCNDENCISAIMREYAVDVAAIVADEGRKKLAMLTQTAPTGSANMTGTSSTATNLVNVYTIRFENFTMDQVLNLKGVMDSEFPDFVRSGNINGSEPIVQYDYRTKAPQNKLFEWLHIAVKDAGITDGKILTDGNRITIKRLGAEMPQRAQPTAGRFQ